MEKTLPSAKSNRECHCLVRITCASTAVTILTIGKWHKSNCGYHTIEVGQWAAVDSQRFYFILFVWPRTFKLQTKYAHEKHATIYLYFCISDFSPFRLIYGLCYCDSCFEGSSNTFQNKHLKAQSSVTVCFKAFASGAPFNFLVLFQSCSCVFYFFAFLFSLALQ